MRSRIRTATFLLVATLGAACGSGAADDTSESTATTGGQAPSSAAVSVKGFAFPATVEVAAGGTVTFTNDDPFAHTVTSGDPREPDEMFNEKLGEPNVHGAQGTTAQITIAEPGTYAYYCILHPAMVGEIIVS